MPSAQASSSRPETLARKLVSALRTARTIVQQAPDRLLHGARRRRAIDRLRRSKPTSILVLCHGNILRSPYIEGALRRHLGTINTRVRSAGFIGPGRSVPPDGRDRAASRGVDLSDHRSRLVCSADLKEADLVLVMNTSQRRAVRKGLGADERAVVMLGDLDPRPTGGRAIEDPIDRPSEVADAIYDRIDRCVSELTRALGSCVVQERHSSGRTRPE